MNSRKFLRKAQRANAIKIHKSYGGDGSETIGLRIPPETRLALSFWALEIPPSHVPKLMNVLEVRRFEAQRGNKLSVEMVQGALTDFYQNIEHVVVVAAIILDIHFEHLDLASVRRVVRAAIDRDIAALARENPNWREPQP